MRTFHISLHGSKLQDSVDPLPCEIMYLQYDNVQVTYVRVFLLCRVRGAGCGVWGIDCGVRSVDCGVRGVDYGVRDMTCKMRGLSPGYESIFIKYYIYDHILWSIHYLTDKLTG